MNAIRCRASLPGCFLLLAALLLIPAAVSADEVRVAVASSFSTAMARLAPLFEQQTGHHLKSSFASTGKLYAQIRQGAPYDLFLAADDERPRRLSEEGLAVADSFFIYVNGRLVLWSATPGLVDAEGKVLLDGEPARLAVANFRTAPYGVAALQVLHALRVFPRWQHHLIQGENVGQAFQFVQSGNVPLGLVAYSQVLALPEDERGSYWLVSQALHAPIAQGAVLLRRSTTNDAARAFLAFLRSPQAGAELTALGYSTAHSTSHAASGGR